MTNGEHGTERLSQPTVPAKPPAATGSTSTDLVQSVTRLEGAIKARRDSDVQLVNWWLYVLVLSWVTLGIYIIYNYYKRMARVDGFTRRKQPYYRALLEWTEREAESSGEADAIHHQIADLGGEVTRAYEKNLRPIKAGISLLLTFVTLGIWSFYVLYRLNRYWWDAQVFEQNFDDKLSQTWQELGVVKYPIKYDVDQTKRRSFPLYLILSIVTLGIWGLVWDYKIQTDPDKLYGEYHSIEDTVLQTVRAS
jgi:hypothetical protein